MSETPETRRDAALAAILAAGGVVTDDCVPLATAEAPHVVCAYRISAGSPTLAVRNALNAIRAQTQSDETDLIEWTPEPEPEAAPDDSIDGPPTEVPQEV